MSKNLFDDRVRAVRRFNRFYTRRIGILQEGLLKSPFSLTEARVIYELAQRGETTATELGAGLDLDAGYLSRILRAFHERRLIEKRSSDTDRRQTILSLTADGREAFARLDTASGLEIAAMLDGLPDDAQERLVGAMVTIEGLLDGIRERPSSEPRLRPPRTGDLGWVIHRHGVLYAREYGWDERFEALVADIVAAFLRDHDPARERCWIAELDGRRVGSVFLVHLSDEVAKLRCLLVEPEARGHGVGTRLVRACLDFARRVGYRKVTLWTNDVLQDARRLYEKAGFRLVHAQRNEDFGNNLIAETWELEL